MADSGSKYNLEAYRKSYFCPVPGCKSDKPQKKLANHIAVQHRAVSAEERHAYLAKAKQVAARRGPTQFPTLAQPTIQTIFTAAEAGPGPSRRSGLQQDYHPSADEDSEPLQRKGKQGTRKGSKRKGRASSATCVTSGESSGSEDEGGARPQKQRAGKGKSRKGAEKGKGRANDASGRHYPRFPTEETFLSSFSEHCSDRLHLGMHANVAKETVVDVSKYLKFCAERCGRTDKLEARHLYDAEAIHDYLTQLEQDGLQAAGQLTKLSRIQTALKFAARHLGWQHEHETKAYIDDITDTMSQWKKALQKQKVSTAKNQLPDISEKIQNLGNYAGLVDNPELRERVALALRGPNPPPPEEFNLVRTYIALHLFISCTQRKSTVENFTIGEFEEASKVEGAADGDHWVVNVHHHKTAASRGPANLVLSEYLHSTMAKYLDFRRGKGKETTFLVNAYGESSKRLPGLVKRMGESFGVTLPTPTLH